MAHFSKIPVILVVFILVFVFSSMKLLGYFNVLNFKTKKESLNKMFDSLYKTL
jgi:hypothetical protein